MRPLYTTTDGSFVSRSVQLITDEAKARNIECNLINENTVIMRQGDNWWYLIGSRTSWMSAAGNTIANHKHLTKQVLHHFNFPTAKSILVESADQLANLNSLQFPVVMKPVNRDHGEGVVVGIADAATAGREYNQAVENDMSLVLFEEMLQGDETRILVVDYQFVCATRRKPAFVIGDGRSTIHQLVDEKNQTQNRGEDYSHNLTLISIDTEVRRYLDEQGFTEQSVPADGQEVPLRRTSNTSLGGEPWNVSHQVSDENKRLFEDIARKTNLNTVGIDVMCQSLSEPVVSQPQAGILELNASPGLRLHHFPVVGDSVNAAAKIVDMMEKYARQGAATQGQL